ncbi:hypothetical protein [Garicola koreensis]|uniref:Putative membrane protein n=1 Tax=Garicola koreensis TaxID=1262554 RepID=A0A7W5TWT5_9MICC|nr:hypothetical protein [Garicola koreensis]MBB3668319.1 putative membrane protein [Garicola koreensis]
MPEKPTRDRLTPWLLSSIPVVMILMFAVPYTLLREVNAWYGSFLFWSVGTVVVIGINVVLTREWKD